MPPCSEQPILSAAPHSEPSPIEPATKACFCAQLKPEQQVLALWVIFLCPTSFPGDMCGLKNKCLFRMFWCSWGHSIDSNTSFQCPNLGDLSRELKYRYSQHCFPPGSHWGRSQEALLWLVMYSFHGIDGRFEGCNYVFKKKENQRKRPKENNSNKLTVVWGCQVL